MKTLLRTLALTLFVASLQALAQPKIGDPAPDFTLQGSDGKTYKLSDFRGKKGVVIAWFPKAFTGGCTTECKSLRENSAQISKAGVALFAASVDLPADNKKFAESLGLDYPILSDPTKETAKAYGVLNAERGVTSRWTFYIGKDGKIAGIDTTPQVSTHGRKIAEQIEVLGLTK